MDNLAELLRGLDRSRLDEAMALLQSLRNDQASQGTENAKQQAGGSPPAGVRSPAVGDASQAAAEPPEAGQIAKASSAETESSPIDEDDTPLAVLGQVLSAEERKNIRDAQKAEREAEREARKKMKDDELQFLKLEADGRKAVMDAERDERRSMRDSEREDRKAAREADKEARRKEQEAEREQRQRAREAELEAKQKAREAEKEALKIPKEAANSLAVFGFLSSAVKTDSKKNKLFSAFVQDKRIVPPALQFWAKPDEAELHNEEDASVVNVPASEAHRILLRDGENSRSRFVDEESSLLHAPICVEQQTAASKPEACVRDFNAMIEASNAPGARPHALLRECGCTFHVAVTAPYASFDNEAVFSGFFAIGYDPCQSRPPYFGTYNHLQEGNLNEVELLQMARFPVGGGIPRLTNIDYEYDSGDDWDVMEGDEDIAASTSEDSEANSDLNSLDSSDLDFINDDDEDDSDCDIQRRIMEGRQRRLFRLRNKDKLVPSYSGPFVGIANDEHPLRSFDEMERIAPLTSTYFSSLLESELNALASGNSGIPAVGDEDLSPEEREAKQQRALMEAALKNRREMTDGELKALHDLVRTNAKISSKMIIAALREQQLCIGVAQAEMARTIRRFYERRRGSLVLRDEPWAATDERLFTPATTAASATSKKAKSTENADQTKAVGEEEDGDGDAEKEKVIEKTEVETTGLPSPAPAAPPASEKLFVEETEAEPLAHNSVGAKEEHAPRAKQMTLMELMPKVSAARDAKRQRENEQAEDQDGGVSTTIVD